MTHFVQYNTFQFKPFIFAVPYLAYKPCKAVAGIHCFFIFTGTYKYFCIKLMVFFCKHLFIFKYYFIIPKYGGAGDNVTIKKSRFVEKCIDSKKSPQRSAK